MDRAGIEALQLGISCNKCPALLRWAARTFGITLPTEKVRVSHKKVDGKMTTKEVERPMTFGATHAKFLRSLMFQLNKLQAAGVEWSDGSRTQGGVEPSEPLTQTRVESGRAALLAYVATPKGKGIAKYLPFA